MQHPPCAVERDLAAHLARLDADDAHSAWAEAARARAQAEFVAQACQGLAAPAYFAGQVASSRPGHPRWQSMDEILYDAQGYAEKDGGPDPYTAPVEILCRAAAGQDVGAEARAFLARLAAAWAEANDTELLAAAERAQKEH